LWQYGRDLALEASGWVTSVQVQKVESARQQKAPDSRKCQTAVSIGINRSGTITAFGVPSPGAGDLIRKHPAVAEANENWWLGSKCECGWKEASQYSIKKTRYSPTVSKSIHMRSETWSSRLATKSASS
jgi:hypothetical protein